MKKNILIQFFIEIILQCSTLYVEMLNFKIIQISDRSIIAQFEFRR